MVPGTLGEEEEEEEEKKALHTRDRIQYNRAALEGGRVAPHWSKGRTKSERLENTNTCPVF